MGNRSQCSGSRVSLCLAPSSPAAASPGATGKDPVVSLPSLPCFSGHTDPSLSSGEPDPLPLHGLCTHCAWRNPPPASAVRPPSSWGLHPNVKFPLGFPLAVLFRGVTPVHLKHPLCFSPALFFPQHLTPLSVSPVFLPLEGQLHEGRDFCVLLFNLYYSQNNVWQIGMLTKYLLN